MVLFIDFIVFCAQAGERTKDLLVISVYFLLHYRCASAAPKLLVLASLNFIKLVEELCILFSGAIYKNLVLLITIDIERKYRLPKVCYVPATSATFLAFFCLGQ